MRTDLALHRYGPSPEEAPTMLFLHGLTDSGTGWPGAVERWQESWSILSVDQRGHGASPRFTEEQLAQHPGDVLVDDALGILEQLTRPPVVVGHSLGGAVALAAAVRRPGLVRALVLEDPAPLDEGEPQRNPGHAQDFLPGIRESLAARDETELLQVRKEKHPTWAEAELLATGVAEQQVDTALLTGGEYKPSPRWPELFAAVRVPTLVVSGDDTGQVCITGDLERRIDAVGNPLVTVARVPGAGHCVRREQPDRFHAVVERFLASLDRP